MSWTKTPPRVEKQITCWFCGRGATWRCEHRSHPGKCDRAYTSPMVKVPKGYLHVACQQYA